MKVLISEHRDNYSINYTLEDKEIFSNVEYKVLRNAENDGFFPAEVRQVVWRFVV